MIVKNVDVANLKWIVEHCPPSMSSHLEGVITALIEQNQQDILDILVCRDGMSLPTLQISSLIQYYTNGKVKSDKSLRTLLSVSYGKNFREEILKPLPLSHVTVLFEYLQSQISGDGEGLPLSSSVSWASSLINSHFAEFVLHTEYHSAVSGLRQTTTNIVTQQEDVQDLIGQVESVLRKVKMPTQNESYSVTKFYFSEAALLKDTKNSRTK